MTAAVPTGQASRGPLDLDAEILAAGEHAAVLVLFTATWCAPCRRLHPEFTRYVAEAPATVRPVTIDVDQQPRVADRFGVEAFPTLLLLAGGRPVLQTSEPRTAADLHRMIDPAAAAALAEPAPPAVVAGTAVAAGAAVAAGTAPDAGAADDSAADDDAADDDAADDRATGARTIALPADPIAGLSVGFVPGTDRRGELLVQPMEPAADLRRVTVPAGWRIVVRIVHDGPAAVARMLEALTDTAIDELVMVVPDVTDPLLAALRDRTGLRRLRIQSSGLPDRGLAGFAALTGLRGLDLNTMGDPIDPDRLQRLRGSLPGTMINGTWTAAPAPSDEEA